MATTYEFEYQVIKKLFSSTILPEDVQRKIESILLEEWNNDIIDRLQEYEGEMSFEECFQQLYDEATLELVLSYGDVFNVLSDHFDNEVYDIIVNDRIDECSDCGCEGIHVDTDANEILKNNTLIPINTENPLMTGRKDGTYLDRLFCSKCAS